MSQVRCSIHCMRILILALLSLQVSCGQLTSAYKALTGQDSTLPSTPSALALHTPSVSPTNNTQPVIEVSGVSAGNLVTLYRDSACSIAASSATTSAGSTVNITVSPALAQGSYTFYAKSVLNGAESDCSPTSVSLVIASVVTWISGANTINSTPTYGVKGVAAASNHPGSRTSAASFKDASGNFWIFGGYGYDSTAAFGRLNDLWKFDGTNWTWIAGSNLAAQTNVYGTLNVADSNNVPSGRNDAALWVDSSGNVWLFGGLDTGSHNDLWKFDGTNWTWVAGTNATNQVGVYGSIGVAAGTNVPGSRYGMGYWIDASDNLYVFGGQVWTPGNNNNSDVWKFDGTNWTWIAGPSSANQFGVYGVQGVAAGANTPGGRRYLISCTDSSYRLWVFGGTGYGSAAGTGKLNDLWRFDGTNWTWLSGSQSLNQSGVYGTMGTADGANVPGGRSAAVCVVDSHDNFWLIGSGAGYDSAGSLGALNDVWKFDGTNWTWVRGSSLINGLPTYGTLGTAATTNMFGARGGHHGWIDSLDRIWIYGGTGYDSTSTSGTIGDLFRFDY